MRYIDVILPVPLRQTFTYHLDDTTASVSVGCRVIVNFGGRQLVTGIVCNTDAQAPTDYTTKPIESILDTIPLISAEQISFWQWMADYYMCSIGDVMKAALPSGLKMENKAKAMLNISYTGGELLKNNEARLYYALSDGKPQEIKQLAKTLEIRNIIPLMRGMVEKGIIIVEDNIKQKYAPKLSVHFKLHERLEDKGELEKAFISIKKAKKQCLFLSTVTEEYEAGKLIVKQEFLKKHKLSSTLYNELLKRGFLQEELKEISRFDFSEHSSKAISPLSEYQNKVLLQIKDYFSINKPTLLHGITASGKTEVYMHLIKEQMDAGKQVLFLLPEIAITIEMLQRLNAVFGNKVSIYHSRYSDAQRVEVWHKVEQNDGPHLVLGARSAIFLPFKNLGLIVVDEEHEESYKQREPSPHYHARDAAVMLSHRCKANIILGSATPSIESSYNAQQGKYGVTHLMERFTKVALPQIETVDMAEAYKKNKRTYHFSFELIEGIKAALALGEQVIIFQNRRGYSGFVECKSCGYIPQCKNCDVSLTYHQYTKKLSCHYCGSSEPFSETCPQCKAKEMSFMGMGTEKVTEHAEEIFPDAKIERFDQDSVKTKGSFDRIINSFKKRDTDILVGTQMIAKGLDFDNVGLVAIMNADNMINYPDFRSHEKAYQMISQVAGRAGRRHKQGKVILQSYTPDYSLIQAIKSYDFSSYYTQQLQERKDFNYPPFVKLLEVTIRHRDKRVSHRAANLYADKIRERFGFDTLGPEEPAISRIKLMYIQKIYIKVGSKYPLQATKNWLLALADALKENEAFKATSFMFDGDV